MNQPQMIKTDMPAAESTNSSTTAPINNEARPADETVAEL